MKTLPELLKEHSEEWPQLPFPAWHDGALAGGYEVYCGQVQVCTLLDKTAVIELRGIRQLTRLENLSADPEGMSWKEIRFQKGWIREPRKGIVGRGRRFREGKTPPSQRAG